MPDSVLVTCEHGGNRVPREYRHLLRPLDDARQTHRGFDAGALQMAVDIAAAFKAPLVTATVTRLLVDLNRSVWNATLHSDPVRGASAEQRQKILNDHYLPYRAAVEREVARAIDRGRRVLHISSHSFTPELDGEVRSADIGLLYDPRREGERAFCALWKPYLATAIAGIRVRRNYPYAGKNDGFTSALRKRFGAQAYIGVELEINQLHIIGAGARWPALRRAVVASLRSTFAAWSRSCRSST
jgi:predicted N-formylglutamate amidohydrolase